MKVALVQMDIRWESAAENREVAERLMLSAEKSDIYVLPEMWNTGVTTEPQGVAEESPLSQPLPRGGEEHAAHLSSVETRSETLQWMQRMADKLDAAVCGSIAVKTLSNSPSKGECSYRNRLYFVMPQETVKDPPLPSLKGREEMVNGEWLNCKFYDKHHLFSFGGETKHYTPGNEYVTVEWRGLRFHLSTCYDLRFPLWLRNRDGYEVLICVASWPSVRMHAWQVLLAARAIENQCYVLGVNRIGKDPYCEYSGGTSVVDPFGFATVAPDNEACVLTKTLDLKRLRSFREKFPVLKERDLFD